MDVTSRLSDSPHATAPLSRLADGVVGSEILRIAAQVRALVAAGTPVCNLTVGDFNPAYFPIPDALLTGTRDALAAGQTNYPPSDGVPQLREAIVRFYERELGLRYPVESVLVAGGARPLLYAAYRALLDPGDVAVYSVPSWNNNHYAYLSGARGVELPVHADTNFFPTPEMIAPHIHHARLIFLNSPLNPTGTAISRAALTNIATMIVEENGRRARSGERPAYLLFDQIYWMLTFGETRHDTPVELVPEIAPYTLLLDGISKAFAATGLRVGWGVMPPRVRQRMADILGHIGAWAPKAEQMATAALLDQPAVIAAFHATMKRALAARLDALHAGFAAMRADGFPVEAIEPQGAIYLSARFNILDRTVRGRLLRSNEDIRQLLLDEAGLAVVPFQAFGLREETGWCRLSVGAVSLEEITAAFTRLRAALVEARAIPATR